ncbi:hypothetical protein M569_07134 [Genlisea aurea]|uniref:DUF7054 domain-containing protein n=1 Tax=Genlisea aurea TaxID=192259 RepID=S8CRZ4_9LAMI|nr:hypothetical protein M569_07134 [Genlisea aurea]
MDNSYTSSPERAAGCFGRPGRHAGDKKQQLSKLLLNVNIQNSSWPVQVLMPPESTVADLVKAALEIYVKEKRRPLLPTGDPQCYRLHYSPFTLDSLSSEQRVMELGSRSFFLCRSNNE